MKRPYLPSLNIVLNTTFDFTDSEWAGDQDSRNYIFRVQVGEQRGVSTLDKRAWSLLTPEGRKLAFQAALIHAASNLIDDYRNRLASER